MIKNTLADVPIPGRREGRAALRGETRYEEPLPLLPVVASAEPGWKFAASRSEIAGTATPAFPIFVRNSRRALGWAACGSAPVPVSLSFASAIVGSLAGRMRCGLR